MPQDTEEAKRQPIPAWGPQILRQALREYRYTSFVAQGSDEERLVLEVRRGNDWIGRVTMEHYVVAKDGKERHDVRMVFTGVEGEHEERFTPHSLRQMQEFAPALCGRICKYGLSRDRSWCDDCSHAERHKQGLFDPPRGPQLADHDGKRRYLADEL